MVLYVVNKDCRLDHLRVKGLEAEMQKKPALEIGAQPSREVDA